MKFFRIIISKVCQEHDVDTKDWTTEKWEVLFKECGDLSDTWLLDVNDVEGWLDMSLWEVVEYNALDGLRFIGVLEPTGDENWYDTYTKEENPNFQRYGAYAKQAGKVG